MKWSNQSSSSVDTSTLFFAGYQSWHFFFLLLVALVDDRRHWRDLTVCFFFLSEFFWSSAKHDTWDLPSLCHPWERWKIYDASLARSDQERVLIINKMCDVNFLVGRCQTLSRKRLHGLAQNGGAVLNKFYTQISFFFRENRDIKK